MSADRSLAAPSADHPVGAPTAASGAHAAHQADTWQAVDDPDEWLAFGRPLPPNSELGAGALWESGVVFEGMYCAACALTLEDALRTVPGVVSAQVSAASHRGRVVWSAEHTRPSLWMQAVLRAGYKVVPANDALAADQRRADTRRMLWRWLVAGLCMMQVMMYATPAYVSAPADFTPDMVALLRWAQWVISLPVLFFSCAPFFKSAWRDVALRRVSMDLPVALGMLITFAVSSLGTFEPQGPFGREVYFDSFTMFVFFLLTGRWLELRLRERTAGALDALLNRLPETVLRECSDGQLETINLRQLKVGDVVHVQVGQALPADAQIVSGSSALDEALLTGESRPVARGAGQVVIAGSYNLQSPLRVQVLRMGQDTRYAQIVALMERAALDKPSLALLADRWARPFLLTVLAVAALACAWWWPYGSAHALMVAVAVLIVTCPCALSLATPAAMLAAAGSMARGGVLVRRLQALEALAAVDTVVFDKTGTLTCDALALQAMTTRPGVNPQVALAQAAALAAQSLHPVSRALSAYAQQQGVQPQPGVYDVQETPGSGVSAQLPGAAGAAPTALRLGSAAHCGVAQPSSHVLTVYLADGHGCLACFELGEDLRSDAAQTVQSLQGLGLQVWMLSGDTSDAVARVANALRVSHARGGCSPQDKLTALRQAQAQGRTVAMVGDGPNDGPVLAAAHASFAFGHAVPLARARSDFVVLGSSLAVVLQALLHARRTVRVVRQNLLWALLYNAVSVPLAVAGWMPAWLAGLGMAASSLVVVLNALRLAGVMRKHAPMAAATPAHLITQGT